MVLRMLTVGALVQLSERRERRDRHAEQVAARICEDVRRHGAGAVRRWMQRLDGVNLHPRDFRIGREEMAAAAARVPADVHRAIRRAVRNIRRVAQRQMPREWRIAVEPGVEVGQIVRPLLSVCCYVPGGRHSLFSTLLMTVIPAQVAGVRHICVTCPHPNDVVLAAAHQVGLRVLWRLGGAQAIAAFAYCAGVDVCAQKIVGPGNRFVTAAKRYVSSQRPIDFLAGPTELVILARRGHPHLIAADLVAQAEHDSEAVAILITTSPALAQAVRTAVEAQCAALPQSNAARKALVRNGGILVVRNWDDAFEAATVLAPEHLALPDARDEVLDRVESAGSVALGPWSAQPFGDYVTGANHTLPTGGGARIRGGLSPADFVKCITIQRVSRDAARRLAPIAARLAAAEGLVAHQRAAEARQ